MWFSVSMSFSLHWCFAPGILCLPSNRPESNVFTQIMGKSPESIINYLHQIICGDNLSVGCGEGGERTLMSFWWSKSSTAFSLLDPIISKHLLVPILTYIVIPFAEVSHFFCIYQFEFSLMSYFFFSGWDKPVWKIIVGWILKTNLNKNIKQ